MPRPAQTWLITDTHFYHDAMVELCGRPTDFNERIIKNLRQQLAPGDTLIHLGDVIFYKYPDLAGILDSIPGRKVLTMGNHDRKKASWYMRNGFHYTCTMIVIDDVLLSHKPVEVLPTGVRLNIHGHWHNTGHHGRPAWHTPETHRVLAIENTGYKAVLLAEYAK